ncbi:MAG: DUF2249 domain-containing protein [Verrucomicrobiota bacterium]
MNDSCAQTLIDVRPMPPRLRHPTIFNTWDQLAEGDAILLVNDHDPVPLYYQFAAEHFGHFRWEYLDAGPDLWRVRISKGDFPDPGFVPQRRPVHSCASPVKTVPPFVLDTRPIFARGETPCKAIDDAVASLLPGQTLVLLVPFEPVPLYAKLGNQGFTYIAAETEPGLWRVEFRRK